MASALLPNISIPVYQLDLIFRRALVFSELFTKSWGSPEVLKLMHDYYCKFTSKGAVMDLIQSEMPEMVIKKEYVNGGAQCREGYFISPLYKMAPELFAGQENVARASWMEIAPKNNVKNGLIIHLAGTGDSTFYRRRFGFANDLLKHGITSILIENPFYGSRRPKTRFGQFGSSLPNVSDLYVMGGSIIAECCFILHWARSEGYFPLGLSGVSLGGHLASLAITNVKDQNVFAVPCLSWTSAAPVYTQGALSYAIPWKTLQEELNKSKSLRDVIESCGWLENMENGPAAQFFPNSSAKRLMWSLMNHFTNLANYPRPINTSLVRAIVASEDAYIPRSKEVPELTQIWPNATVHVIPNKGHVSAYFCSHSIFRQAIIDLALASNQWRGIDFNPTEFIDSTAGLKMRPDIRIANQQK